MSKTEANDKLLKETTEANVIRLLGLLTLFRKKMKKI